MQTVADDDLLLSRGANPRTGVISPDKLSFDDSTQQSKAPRILPQARESPPQWLQKGDQWISTKDRFSKNKLVHGSRTPNSVQRTGLRKPRKLVQGNIRDPNQDEWSGQLYDLPLQTRYPLPNQHVTPAKANILATAQRESEGARLGVEVLPTKLKAAASGPEGRHHPIDVHLDNLVPPPLLLNSNNRASPETRSSSAPIPQKFEQPTTSDCKALPYLPGRLIHHSPATSFDRVPNEMKTFAGSSYCDQHPRTDKACSGERFTPRRINKELPRLPTSNFHSSRDPLMESQAAQTLPAEHRIDAELAAPGSRFASSPTVGPTPAGGPFSTINITNTSADPGYKAKALAMQLRRKRVGGLSAVPVYDNPPMDVAANFNPRCGQEPETMAGQSLHAPKAIESMSLRDPFTETASSPGIGQTPSPRQLTIASSSTQPNLHANADRRCSRCHRSYDGSHELPDQRKLSMGPDGPEPLPILPVSSSIAGATEQCFSFNPLRSSPTPFNKSPTAQTLSYLEEDTSSSGQISVLSQTSRFSAETTLVGENYQLVAKSKLLDHTTCCRECCSSGCHNGCLGHDNFSGGFNASSSISVSSDNLLNARSIEGTPEDNKTLHRRQIQPNTALTEKHGNSPETYQLNIKKARRKRLEDRPSLTNFFNVKRARRVSTELHQQASSIDKGKVTVGPSKTSDIINADRKITPLTGWTKVTKKARQPNGLSIRSIAIPTINDANLAEAWELMMMPFAALRMWLQNNPQVKRGFWSMLQFYWTMVLDVHATSQILLNMVYVYSKTGKIETNQDVMGVELMRDCLRGTFYMIILAASMITFIRMIRVVLFPVTVVFWTVRWLTSGVRQANSSTG